MFIDWQEQLHPRAGKGLPTGGQFVSKGGSAPLPKAPRTIFTNSVKLTPDQVKALRAYQGNYKSIDGAAVNSYMRDPTKLDKLAEQNKGVAKIVKTYHKQIDALNSILEKERLAQDAELWRLLGVSFGNKLAKQGETLIGQVIRAKGFQSTSKVTNFHPRASELPVMMKISVKAGTPAIDINAHSGRSEWSGQQEVLLGEGTYTVTGFTKIPGQKQVLLSVDFEPDLGQPTVSLKGIERTTEADREKISKRLKETITSVKKGLTFVSPNIDTLDFNKAIAGLKTSKQTELKEASEFIDRELGLDGTSSDIVGAWEDGAENSVMDVVNHSDWDKLVVSAAMKGWVAHQKSVLVFQQLDENEIGADAVLAKFEAKGSLNHIHTKLLSLGIENHTLVPNEKGATVYVVDLDGSMKDAVKAGAEHYGSEVEIDIGRAEFIGTDKQDGTDQEQRDSARSVFEGIIDQSPVEKSAAVWQRVRDRWGAPTTAGQPGDLENVFIAEGKKFSSAILYSGAGDGSIVSRPIEHKTWKAKGTVEQLEQQAIEAVKQLGGEEREFGAFVDHSNPLDISHTVALIRGERHKIDLNSFFEQDLEVIGAKYNFFHNHPKPNPISLGDIGWLSQHPRVENLRDDDMKGGWSSVSMISKDFGVEQAINIDMDIRDDVSVLREIMDRIDGVAEKTRVVSFMLPHAINLVLAEQGIINYQFRMSDWHQQYLDRFAPEFDRQLDLTRAVVKNRMQKTT